MRNPCANCFASLAQAHQIKRQTHLFERERASRGSSRTQHHVKWSSFPRHLSEFVDVLKRPKPPEKIKAGQTWSCKNGQKQESMYFDDLILPLTPGTCSPPILRNHEKGVLAKGVSAESSVTPKETENNQGYWARECIWHSERRSQERRKIFAKKPLLEKALLYSPPTLFFLFNSTHLGG